METACINQELELYLWYKRYNQPMCGVFPIVATNTLKNELCITNKTENDIYDLITPPLRSLSEPTTLYLHRTDGYNSLLKSKPPVFVSPAAALTTPVTPYKCHIKPFVTPTVRQVCSKDGLSQAT